MLNSFIGFLETNLIDIFFRFLNLLSVPFKNVDARWMVIPLLITILVMEYYYSRYKKDEVGWNSATVNSMVLIFISMDLFRFLSAKDYLSFMNPGSYAFSASLLILIVLFEGILLFFLDMTRLWPKFLAFNFSSYLTINLIAYTSIVVIYGAIPIDIITAIAAVLFFILMNLLAFLIRIVYLSKKQHN